LQNNIWSEISFLTQFIPKRSLKQQMLTFPNAKINIGLSITEKRSDGFHNLASCFYPVGWSDVLEILPAEATSFKSSGIPIPGDAQNNLCLKAYNLLKTDFDIPPVMIHLHKVVPIGAGLGGGSADCAFTIKTLNELFELNLSVMLMEDYARKLGSDCAFFIQNRPQFCTGKGDEFSEIKVDLSGKYIVLVNPNIHIPEKTEIDLKEILQSPISQWVNVVKNDFENHLLPKYPAIANIKNQLYHHGAAYASMTGSGSTVFGIFEEEINLQEQFSGYSIWQGKL
jgi:4-diphosphocytidyl-2-C-methyl-D-erythritol kinase